MSKHKIINNIHEKLRQIVRGKSNSHTRKEHYYTIEKLRKWRSYPVELTSLHGQKKLTINMHEHNN